MEKRERKNVLILESIFHLGGAEKITYGIVSRMNKERYNIILCTLYHPGPMGEVFINDGYKFHHDLIKSKFDYRVFFKLRKIVMEDKINLIYLINQPLTLFWGFVIGKIFKIPIVSIIHNTVITEEHVKLKTYKLLIPFISKVVTVANMQKDHLVKNERIPEKLITVIYNGIDVRKYDISINKSEKFKSLGLGVSSKIVGIVTRMVNLKGNDIFLQAAKIVLQHNSKTRFIIVGDGPEMTKMKLLAAEMNIDEKVHFLGVRHDINELINLFDVAVISSRTEALPVVLLEYMAAGKAIVATNVGSIPELLVDGYNGSLIEPADSKALAEKVLSLLDNEELAKLMGNNAKKLVNRSYRIENTVKKTEELIDELID